MLVKRKADKGRWRFSSLSRNGCIAWQMRVRGRWENQSLFLISSTICKTMSKVWGLIQKASQIHMCWPFWAQDRIHMYSHRQDYILGHMPSPDLMVLFSCKCLRPFHTVITYRCKTPFPEPKYSSLSEVHLFIKLYSVPWRSTDSDVLGMEMGKGFQTGRSLRRSSLQYPDG